MKDVLTEAMDLEGLIALLAGIRTGSIRCLAVDSAVPSAFAHELLNANPYAFLDDAPLEERRARAVSMRGMVPDKLLGEAGQLFQSMLAVDVKRTTLPRPRAAVTRAGSLTGSATEVPSWLAWGVAGRGPELGTSASAKESIFCA